ncbi:hypothetical protein DIPPA_16597 [Diplonema papillatum]|nr:hypothetical protein DIPPA_16597 [Diplonema papillatum]
MSTLDVLLHTPHASRERAREDGAVRGVPAASGERLQDLMLVHRWQNSAVPSDSSRKLSSDELLSLLLVRSPSRNTPPPRAPNAPYAPSRQLKTLNDLPLTTPVSNTSAPAAPHVEAVPPEWHQQTAGVVPSRHPASRSRSSTPPQERRGAAGKSRPNVWDRLYKEAVPDAAALRAKIEAMERKAADAARALRRRPRSPPPPGPGASTRAPRPAAAGRAAALSPGHRYSPCGSTAGLSSDNRSLPVTPERQGSSRIWVRLYRGALKWMHDKEQQQKDADARNLLRLSGALEMESLPQPSPKRRSRREKDEESEWLCGLSKIRERKYRIKIKEEVYPFQPAVNPRRRRARGRSASPSSPPPDSDSVSQRLYTDAHARMAKLRNAKRVSEAIAQLNIEKEKNKAMGRRSASVPRVPKKPVDPA